MRKKNERQQNVEAVHTHTHTHTHTHVSLVRRER